MTCKECKWWEVDMGIWCANGWSGDGSKGYCQYEPNRISKSADDKCHNWESAQDDNN